MSAGETSDLLIVGASARAAAYSALRAGLVPCAVDQFGDRDLAAVARGARLGSLTSPNELDACLAALPNCPWIYTGALENHPDDIDHIAAQRPLWGIGGAALGAIRDPFNVANIIGRAGFSTPALRGTAAELPRDGSWLVKPFRSAGGRGIHALVSENDANDADVYFQERVHGLDLSAVFVAAGGAARLLGLTRQLLGILGEPFVYRGNIGPWPLAPRVVERVAELGSVIGANLPVVGLFGVDFVLHRDEPWLIEINPRYTGAVEVLELAYRSALLAHHVRACRDLTIATPRPAATEIAWLRRAFGTGVPRTPHPQPLSRKGSGEQESQTPDRRGGARRSRTVSTAGRFVGKAILYAAHDTVIEELLPLTTCADDNRFGVPELADVPAADTVFRAGEPVVTVFSEAESLTACAEGLEAAAKRWSARLRLGPSPEICAHPELTDQRFA
jgi:predicted ATP-grasp superfamily ATP-dependent carboligase